MRQVVEAALCTVAVIACGGPDATGVVSVRDSAGIQIIENRAPGPGLPRWTIPDTPLVSIGGADEGPEALSRVTDVMWSRDDAILVVEGSAGEIRRFDATGTFLDRIGRKGDGPGEFRYVGAAWERADSLVAMDPGLRRITVFDSAGTPVRTLSLQDIAHPYMVQPLSAGRALAGFIQMDTSGATSGPTTRLPYTLAAIPLDTARLDTLLVLPGMESYPVLASEGDRSFPATSFPIFGKQSVVRTHGGSIYTALNDAYQVTVHDSAGTPTQVVRLGVPAVDVTEADHRTHVERESRSLDERNASAPQSLRDQWRAQLRERRVAKQFPFIADLIVAPDGHLWVEGYRPENDDPRHYLIFDEGGFLVAQAEAPARVRIMAARHDAVLTIWRDLDDLQHVRIYPVIQSGAPPAD